MKRYFLHDGREQTGPFVLEELKKQALTPELMVWHDGIPNWVNITMLEELKPLLKPVVPPPFKGVAPPAAHQSPTTINVLKTFNLNNSRLKRIGVGVGIAILLLFVIRFIVSPGDAPNSRSTNKIRIGKSPRTEHGTNKNTFNDEVAEQSNNKATRKNSADKENLDDENNKPATTDEQKKEENDKKVTEQNEHMNPLRFIEGEGNAKQSLWNNKIIINGVIKNKATAVTYKDFIIEISYLTDKRTFLSAETKSIKDPVFPGEEIDFRFKLDPPVNAKSCVWKVIGASIGASNQRIK